MNTNKGKYPVDSSGDMIDYPDAHYNKPENWFEIKPFTAALEYKGFQQGRSSVRFIVQDCQIGVTYTLMRNSFDTFIKKASSGVLRAEYIVVKRGANYGLVLTEDL